MTERKAKIYWTPEVEQKILSTIKPKDNNIEEIEVEDKQLAAIELVMKQAKNLTDVWGRKDMRYIDSKIFGGIA